MPIIYTVAAAALSLFGQDPPPGEVISTAPRPATAADPTYAEPATPTAAASGRLVWARTPLGSPPSAAPAAPAAAAFDWSASGPGYAAATREGGYSRSAAAAASAPLPPEALADPVRYAADQCRPQVRPAGEDVADCFDRIDRAVRAEQNARAAARRPQVRCNSTATRDDDRRTSSTSGGCSIGTGDPELLNRTLGW